MSAFSLAAPAPPRGHPARWLGWLVGLLLALPALADPPGRVGRVAEVRGSVWQLDTEKNEWVEAARNQPVVGGDRLRTDGDGAAVVQIGSATVRLAGLTEVEWLRLDDAGVSLQVHAGSVGLRVRSAETAREFEIVAPPGRYLPLYAGHYRVDRLQGASAGQSLVGEMVFEAEDSRKRVDAGQRFEFWQRGDPPVTHQDTVVATPDDFGLWLLDAERNEPREAVATRYVSPEMTGWEDLDRYGRWDRHPTYGTVWLPHGVAPGWAPYRYGRWAWVRPWGWTWIDAMPWGFAPFHYGRWVWWGGAWGWVPGPYVPRPVFAPALVGWIGGPNVNIGISIGTGPWVGWVPLAPWDVYRPWYPVTPRHPHYVRPRVPGWRPPPPMRYGHADAPGAVTVVPSDVLTQRRPIGEREVKHLDPGTVRRIATLPPNGAVPPPPRGAQPVPAPGPGPNTMPGGPVATPRPPVERGPRPVPRDAREYRDGREWPGRSDTPDAERQPLMPVSPGPRAPAPGESRPPAARPPAANGAIVPPPERAPGPVPRAVETSPRTVPARPLPGPPTAANPGVAAPVQPMPAPPAAPGIGRPPAPRAAAPVDVEPNRGVPAPAVHAPAPPPAVRPGAGASPAQPPTAARTDRERATPVPGGDPRPRQAMP